MNNNMNPDGLARSLLLLRVLLRFSAASSELPNQAEGMRALPVSSIKSEKIS